MTTIELPDHQAAALKAVAASQGLTLAAWLEKLVQEGEGALSRRDMMALDWSRCAAVESIPGKVGGAWVFKGTRTPVSIVFENLQDGMTVDELMEQYPLTREEISAVLEFAAHSLETPHLASS